MLIRNNLLSSFVNAGGRTVLAATRFLDGELNLILDSSNGGDAAVTRVNWNPVGSSFTLRRLKSRFCTGWYDIENDETGPCPHQTRLEFDARSNQCAQCLARTGFNPFFYNMSPEKISAKQKRYNAQPHVVYIAYFGENTIKVGISHERRVLVRLVEQGAWSAFVFYGFENALQARHRERQLATVAGISEVVSGRKKREILSRVTEVRDVKSVLESVVDRLSWAKARTEARYVDLREYYGDFEFALGSMDASSTRPYVVTGQVQAFIGPSIVTSCDHMKWAFAVDAIYSHRCTFESELETVDLKGAQPRLI